MQREIYTDSLAAVPAFQELSPKTLEAMAHYAFIFHLEAGDTLRHQGEPAHTFYAIQKGALRLLRCTPQGHEVTLKIYGPGDVFGLLAVSGDYSGGATVEAIHKTEVIALLGQDIRQLMYTHGDLGVLITDLLVAHVHHAHKRLGNMTALRVDERLAASLLELAEKFGELCSSGIMIDVPLTQQDLAQFIGATPETVSRTLKTWSQNGLLQKERRHIILLKPASLLRIADGHSMT